jgi:hypothetical protein
MFAAIQGAAEREAAKTGMRRLARLELASLQTKEGLEALPSLPELQIGLCNTPRENKYKVQRASSI